MVEFAYESAMARVSNELSDLAEELLPDIEKICEKYRQHVPKDEKGKIKCVSDNLYFLPENIRESTAARKFYTLLELQEGRYWHATDKWPFFRLSLSKQDERFYATLMIEQAKRGLERGRSGRDFGYAWIVRNYHEGHLREFVSGELLVEAVNRGFWHFANEYLTRHLGGGVSLSRGIWEYYDSIMNYSILLDLTRVSELKGEKPLRGGWVDESYMKSFERAKSEVSTEDGARLAHPIIDEILAWWKSEPHTWQDPEKILEKKLKPYQEFFSTDLIQQLFRENVETCISEVDSQDYSYEGLSHAKILIKYLTLSEPELQEFISPIFLNEVSDLECVINSDFPKNWLTQQALAEVQVRITQELDKPPYSWKKKPIVPHLRFLQEATKKRWLDERIGKERLKSGLENYFAAGRRPAGEAVRDLLRGLKSELVEQELYRQIVHQGISDLVKRNKIREASVWYRKAQIGGWLDKSKVPDFELQ